MSTDEILLLSVVGGALLVGVLGAAAAMYFVFRTVRGFEQLEAETSRLLQSGTPAQAQILSVHDLASSVQRGGQMRQHRMQIDLRVHPPGGPPFDASCVQLVSMLHMSGIRPGASVHVRYDPPDPNRVAVDLSAPSTAPAAAPIRSGAGPSRDVAPSAPMGNTASAGNAAPAPAGRGMGLRKVALFALLPMLLVGGAVAAVVGWWDSEGRGTEQTPLEPVPPGKCGAVLTVTEVRAPDGCSIDERVSKRSARLIYPCAGGAARAAFGDAVFTGTFSSEGEIDISLDTTFEFSDGCTWSSVQRIAGTKGTRLAYHYREAPLEGERGCAAGCEAEGHVQLSE